MAKRDVRVGQLYRPVGRTYLGRSQPLWAVAEIYTGTDGLGYVKLEHSTERRTVKTLGVGALLDTHLFLLEEG